VSPYIIRVRSPNRLAAVRQCRIVEISYCVPDTDIVDDDIVVGTLRALNLDVAVSIGGIFGVENC